MKTIRIYCTVCKQDVAAQECYGRHIYLRRPDLDDKRFYMCPTCGNYVGTHKDGRPLGTIPSPELRDQISSISSKLSINTPNYERWLDGCLRKTEENIAALEAGLERVSEAKRMLQEEIVKQEEFDVLWSGIINY